jgi:hypothetical protein
MSLPGLDPVAQNMMLIFNNPLPLDLLQKKSGKKITLRFSIFSYFSNDPNKAANLARANIVHNF